MPFTQITKRAGRIDRVKGGKVPTIELDLEPHQYVTSVKLEPVADFRAERKTTDWRWELFVVTQLGDPDGS